MREISIEEFLAGVELRKSLIAQVADYEAHPERAIDITDMSHDDRLAVVRGFDPDNLAEVRAKDGSWMPAQRIEARSDETPQEARPEGREPDGEADAP